MWKIVSHIVIIHTSILDKAEKSFPTVGIFIVFPFLYIVCLILSAAQWGRGSVIIPHFLDEEPQEQNADE